MRLFRVIPLAIVCAAIGCNSTDILRLDSTPRPRTHPHSVRLIAQEPQQPYTVIAIVAARDGLASARDLLIKEAARLGGHAVLLDAGSLTRISNGGDLGGTTLQLSGKVIVFTDSTRSNVGSR